MVNSRSTDIFNGILQTWNRGKSTEKFAKIALWETYGPRVYLAGIKHAGAPYGGNGLLTLAMLRISPPALYPGTATPSP